MTKYPQHTSSVSRQNLWFEIIEWRYVRFSLIDKWCRSGMSNLASKLDQICPKLDKSGTFKDQFKYILARRGKKHVQKQFRNSNYQNATALSTFVWERKMNPIPKVKWEVLRVVPPYKSGQTSCQLCLEEKIEAVYRRKAIILTRVQTSRTHALSYDDSEFGSPLWTWRATRQVAKQVVVPQVSVSIKL